MQKTVIFIIMIPVDFHSHSLFSGCGVHTVMELLNEACRLGMKGLAVTDHGRFIGGKANSVFFERLSADELPGVRLLKGIEANADPKTHLTDVNPKFLPMMDVVLLGLHDNVPADLAREDYTALMIRTLEKNPFVDIVTHLNSPTFPVDYDLVTEAAVRLGVVVEMNNAKCLLKRTPDEEAEKLIEACLKRECRVAVNSDAHCLHELGRDEEIRTLLARHRYPEELIVNRTAEAAFAFVEERRALKKR